MRLYFQRNFIMHSTKVYLNAYNYFSIIFIHPISDIRLHLYSTEKWHKFVLIFYDISKTKFPLTGHDFQYPCELPVHLSRTHHTKVSKLSTICSRFQQSRLASQPHRMTYYLSDSLLCRDLHKVSMPLNHIS